VKGVEDRRLEIVEAIACSFILGTSRKPRFKSCGEIFDGI